MEAEYTPEQYWKDFWEFIKQDPDSTEKDKKLADTALSKFTLKFVKEELVPENGN